MQKTKRIKHLLAFMLLFSILIASLGATQSFATSNDPLSKFVKGKQYTEGQFKDIPADAWYKESVKHVYELGLMSGVKDNEFAPDGNITKAQAVTLAARIHSIATNKVIEIDPTKATTQPWYVPYRDYCVKEGLYDGGLKYYERNADRAFFISLMSKTLPDGAFSAINKIEELPDVSYSSCYNEDALKFYNAGILSGLDKQGSFQPNKPITRAEVATLLTRMLDKSLRKTFTLEAITPEERYDRIYESAYIGLKNFIATEKNSERDVKGPEDYTPEVKMGKLVGLLSPFLQKIETKTNPSLTYTKMNTDDECLYLIVHDETDEITINIKISKTYNEYYGMLWSRSTVRSESDVVIRDLEMYQKAGDLNLNVLLGLDEDTKQPFNPAGIEGTDALYGGGELLSADDPSHAPLLQLFGKYLPHNIKLRNEKLKDLFDDLEVIEKEVQKSYPAVDFKALGLVYY